jgi:hypothetical protein
VLLLLLACLDPAPAIELCLANPGLHSNPTSVATWTPLLDPEELALLTGAQPSQGSVLLGPQGIQTLASTATCTVTAHQRSGEIELERERYRLNAQGEQTGRGTETLRWTLQAGRVHINAAQAIALREKAFEEEEPERAAEQWIRVIRTLPDPTLDVDLAIAEASALAQQTRMQTTNTFHNRQGELVHAELVNGSPHDLASAVILVRLVDPGEKPTRRMAPPGVRVLPTPAQTETLRVELGPVDSGARLPYTFTLPPNSGSFRLSTDQVTLQ